MGTAIFAGVSGLRSQQQKLDVIGNNIANVSTTGFRSGRAVFQDLFSQTLTGASSGSQAGISTTNPVQIGLGVQLASVDVNFQQGAIQSTGNPTDLAIQGGGFFILSDGQANFYTRDGTFGLGADGRLIDPATGFVVQGFPATDGIVDTSIAGDLQIPIGTTIVRDTTLAEMGGNLDSAATPGDTFVRTLRVFDSLGTPHDLEVTFTKSATPNQYDFSAIVNNGVDIADTGTITFSGATGAVTAGGTANISITLPVAGGATSPLAFAVDFNQITQFASDTTATLLNQDGLAPGELQSFLIGQGGEIQGVFSNGLTQVLGQIALGDFPNPGGLLRVGRNMFRPTLATGAPQINIPQTGSLGALVGGSLEGSNVDLAREFSEMIITQRSFQANARTITTADTMLNEVVNIVR